MSSHLQVITHADPLTCQEIRREVFIKEQQVDADLDVDGRDDESTLFLVTVDGEPVATGRLRQEGDALLFERIAAKSNFRGQGVGKALVNAMAEFAGKEHPEHRRIMKAQRHAEEFYKKLGWVSVGYPFDMGGVSHVIMACPAPFTASREELPNILTWINLHIVDLRQQLICEEIVMNIISHAYPDSPGPLRVAIGEGMILFMDKGIPFNPLEKREAPKLDAPLEAREPGGLGLHMIDAFSKRAEYSQEHGENVLLIEFLPASQP